MAEAQPAADKPKHVMYCSFCGKSQHEVAKLIAGPATFTCDECTRLCQKIIETETEALKKAEAKWTGTANPDFATPNTYPTERLLGLLATAETALERVSDQVQHYVDTLRDREVSWADIGNALGVSRQAAWRRFA